MKRLTALFLILTVACSIVRADDVAETKAAVKEAAQEAAQATVDGDYAALIDLTYPDVVEAMGGRDKAIATVEVMLKQVKDQGIVLKSMKVGEPAEFVTDDDDTIYVVVPTVTELDFPQGSIKVRSYLLGISDDDGDSWTFADGSALDNQDFRKQVLGELPEDLELPKPQQPEVILNQK